MRGGETVAVVIPALNEERAIGSVLEAIPAWVDDVVAGDNGSTDRTVEEASNRGARVVREPRRGYGSACLTAIAALGRPDVVVFLDGDFSDHPEEMATLVDPIVAGEVDLVIGSRVRGPCAPGALTPQARFGNWLSCLLLRLLWRVRYTDLGPFWAIRRASLEQLGMRDPDYGWTVEMQIRAAVHGLRSLEVPVSYRARIGQSKVSGTLRGVVGAGTKILYMIAASALQPRRPRPNSQTPNRLIVFTRYPEPGKVKTRLAPELGEAGAARLHRDMTALTLNWADQLKQQGLLSVEVRFDGGSRELMEGEFGDGHRFVAQGDGDLGVRLKRAVEEAAREGVKRIVLVGTDCPELCAEVAQRAFDSLRRCDLVVGPARDGGYYLIGLRRTQPGLFTDMPWGTSGVLEATVRRAREMGLSLAMLQELSDVDRPEDLALWDRIAEGWRGGAEQ